MQGRRQKCLVGAEPVIWTSGSLILNPLPSCEPLHKLCQSGWEGSLDRTVGSPQSLSQPLKVTGGQRLIQRSRGWRRQGDCRGIGQGQSLHRDTLVDGTEVPVNAPIFSPLFRVAIVQCSGILRQLYGQDVKHLVRRHPLLAGEQAPDRSLGCKVGA